MNLVFDLGNSYGKIAVCEGIRVVEASTYEKITSREIAYYHARYAGLKGAIVSSVVNYSREIIDYLNNLYNICIMPPQYPWKTCIRPRTPLGTIGSLLL